MSRFTFRPSTTGLWLAARCARTSPLCPPTIFTRSRQQVLCSLPQTTRWNHTAKWRPVSVLDEWVAKEARPISLRQLMVFGRSLTESRLIASANYIRTELPTRIAHRLRDMQRLPYVVVTNPHIGDVYELYYNSFDQFRRVREIKSLEDNDRFCRDLANMLRTHLTIIPKLAMGILECSSLMPPADLDRFMNTMLRSRISRRVIAEQHLALTDTFNSNCFAPGANLTDESEFIGEVFLRCTARDVIHRCADAVRALAREANGPQARIPEIRVDGHLDATFPYILSHLEYIVGELLRNSVQALVDRHSAPDSPPPPPIEVTICEAQRHIIIRISDQGGGIPRDTLPYLWSFGRGPQKSERLENLVQVPLMAATLQELRVDGNFTRLQDGGGGSGSSPHSTITPNVHFSSDGPIPGARDAPPPHSAEAGSSSSLSTLSSRPPNLRLGMGLPLSRVYAEYWAGSLGLHSLEGYGVDAFLQISKLGNKNEQLATRAAMDAV